MPSEVCLLLIDVVLVLLSVVVAVAKVAHVSVLVVCFESPGHEFGHLFLKVQ